MKHLAGIVLLAAALLACSPISHIPADSSVSGIDFREYTERGFLFSPWQYDGRYESVGVIEVTMFPEANRVSSRTRGGATETHWEFERITVSEMTAALYEQAREMGADALVEFDLRGETRELTNPTATMRGLTASGFAIRRLDH